MRLLVLLAMLATPVCALAQSHSSHDHHSHVSQHGDLRAVHAWTRATTGNTALVFMELENTGTDRLMITGAQGPRGAPAELVGFTLQNGQARLQPVGRMPLNAGHALRLEPNGLALQITGLDAALAQGEAFDLELQTDHGTLPVHVEIGAPDATGHSHAGHSH